MITDEQINEAYEPIRKAGYVIHHLGCVKDALEAYEQSKWMKFDVDDESSYPPIESGSGIFSEKVITNGGDIAVFFVIRINNGLLNCHMSWMK